MNRGQVSLGSPSLGVSQTSNIKQGQGVAVVAGGHSRIAREGPKELLAQGGKEELGSGVPSSVTRSELRNVSKTHRKLATRAPPSGSSAQGTTGSQPPWYSAGHSRRPRVPLQETFRGHRVQCSPPPSLLQHRIRQIHGA